MNYQSIRAKLEAPLLAAYNSEVPAIPVYFDNVSAVPPDSGSEYVRVNITFGLTTEATLEGSLDYARGALIIRCFAPKNKGPARCQKMAQLAKAVIDAINNVNKGTDSTYVRIGRITGPSFQAPEGFPHFVGRIDAGWQASKIKGGSGVIIPTPSIPVCPPSGPCLPGGASYVHNQLAPSTTWTIAHNLGFKPSVELLNSGSQEIEGDVVHMSQNVTVVYFTTPITGFARLN